VAETHISTVLFDGDLAIKRYKPVRTGFLDHTTVEGRRRDCEREVALNRRLAPDVYLGVAEVRGPDGEVCDHLVLMRRLDPSRRLATLARAGGGRDEVVAVAQVMAAFHAAADRSPVIDAVATPEALHARWEADLAELAGTTLGADHGAMLAEVADLAERSLRARRPMLHARIAGGHIVDAQGDLLADDIFWSQDGPMLLDCLDFDDRLRHVDGIDDAAFLAMDLEFLGRPDLAQRFVADYRACADDPAPASLADFYIAYRAVVRAKVECIRVEQGHPEVAANAARHLRIAVEHLRAAIPRLVLVGGGPGTGKTTVSRALAESVGAVVISTDDVRRELVAAGVLDGQPGSVDAGLYAPEQVVAVYRDVLCRAEAALAAGSSVILDGTWRDDAQRAAAGELASRTGAAFVECVCEVPLAAAQQRIAARVGSTSDATAEVAAALANGAERPGAHRIDTGRPVAAIADETTRLYRRAVPEAE